MSEVVKAKRKCHKSGTTREDFSEMRDRHVYSADSKTKLEVTVKLKRRKSPKADRGPDGHGQVGQVDEQSRQYKNHKTGSWGDLLKSKNDIIIEAKKENRKVGAADGDSGVERTFERKLNRDYKIEVKTKARSKVKKPSSLSPEKSLLHPSNKEYEKERIGRKSSKSKSMTTQTSLYLPSQTQGPHPQIMKQQAELDFPKTTLQQQQQQPVQLQDGSGDYIDHGHGRQQKQNLGLGSEPAVEDQQKMTISVSDEAKNLKRIKYLESENLFLRQEASKLLKESEEMTEKQKEHITTIKELYQLAEMLKNENHQLLEQQLKQRFIKEKFAQTLHENEQLRERLEYLLNQIPDQPPVQDDQIYKFKETIKDVRKTIANEIECIRNQSFSLQNDPRISSEVQQFLHMSGQSGDDLNSTNSSDLESTNSEVNRILYREIQQEAFSKRHQGKQAAGSSSSDSNNHQRRINDSTQYMTVTK